MVLILSCSFLVQDKQIQEALPNTEFDTIEVKTSIVSPGYPLYREDVMRVVDAIFSKLNTVANQYIKIHIFAAIPAGMAVELGRNLLQSVYFNVVTYQMFQGKYVEAITINPTILESKNIVQRTDNILYVERFNQDIEFLPILGEIACGTISEAILECDEHMPISASVLGSGDHFIIKAVGESMIEADIDDGDLVVIRRQSTAEDGQIVVARASENTTLKRMIHDIKRKKIILRSANPNYYDQKFDDIEIQGIAIKVIKNVK